MSINSELDRIASDVVSQVYDEIAKITDRELEYSDIDLDGDLESGTSIQWSRDSTIITSLDDSTSVSSSFLSKGETWAVTVTPSDGTDFGSPVSSSPIIVQNTPPVVDSLSISPTDPTEIDDLTMSYSFSDSDLDIDVTDGTLTVEGNQESGDGESEFIHQGIAQRKFRKSWSLADTVVVKGAKLTDGILKIALENQIPEEKKPQTIKISTK